MPTNFNDNNIGYKPLNVPANSLSKNPNTSAVVSMGANSSAIGATPAEIKQSVKSGAENNLMVKKVSQTSDDPTKTLGMTAAYWLGLVGISMGLNKNMGGEYSKSLLGKVDNLGTSITNAPVLSQIKKSTGGFFSTIKKWGKAAVDKSEILHSIIRKPAVPKSKMVKNMRYGSLNEISSDCVQLIEKMKEVNPKLDIRKIGKSTFEAVKKAPNEHAKNMEIFLRKHANRLGDADKFNIGGKIMPRHVRVSEFANKLQSLNGKGLSKPFLRSCEGITNGMFGPMAFVAIQAYSLVDATKAAKEAPKGDKLSTFMERMSQDLSMYLTLPYSIKLLYGLGGLKNIGMTDANYNNVLKLVEKADTAAKTGVKSGQSLKYVKNLVTRNKGKIKEIYKEAGKNVKWYQRPFRFVGKILGSNLGITESIKTGSRAKDLLGTIGGKIKNASPSVMRFAIAMFVISPVLGSIGARISHLIFGRPKKSLLDKEDSPKLIKKLEKSKLPLDEYINMINSNPNLSDKQKAKMIEERQGTTPQLTPEEENQFVQIIKQQNIPSDQLDQMLTQSGLSDAQKQSILNKLNQPSSAPQTSTVQTQSHPGNLVTELVNKNGTHAVPVQPQPLVQNVVQNNPQFNPNYAPQTFPPNTAPNTSQAQPLPAKPIAKENKSDSLVTELPRTYIPSTQTGDYLNSDEQEILKNKDLDALFAKADIAEKAAMKFLS